MNCKFKDKHDRCTIGCKSIGIGKTETCPFIFTLESFKTCPCHPEGLTFILADRVSKIRNKLIDNAILTNPTNFPYMPPITNTKDREETKEELKEMATEEDKEDKEEVERLQIEGHTYHCACRIVWGDGQCECENIEIIEEVKYNE